MRRWTVCAASCWLPLALYGASLADGPAPPAEAARFESHAPVRPLPTAAARPLADGPTYYVDPAAGDDGADGTREHPWRSIGRGVQRLRPGDTLCLRGGVYYEHVAVALRGTPGRPITLRAYPGELAVIDGGLREFAERPADCWEPCPGGVAGEYRSTGTYPGLGGESDSVHVRGLFADSLVPLQGYRYVKDLRDDSMSWDIESKTTEEEGVYCGPGLFFDAGTGRLHCRLSHTDIQAIGDDNYRGQTDPRRLPLIVAGLRDGAVLTVRGASDARFQDLVLRGTAAATIDIADSARLTFDGLTVYGGHAAFEIRDTHGLRLWNTVCRGPAAPWTFRGHLKYRSTESRIFSASGWQPTGNDNRDFELAWCEFTDSVDGVFVGNVRGVHFHHNLLDNVSDDGIFLSATTGYDGVTPGGAARIEQNLLARCLTTLAFGVGHGRQKATPRGIQTGAGVTITRNVFDFRRPVMYQLPADVLSSSEIPSRGRFAGDHGSPAWEPMTIYHNTLLADDPVPTGYGTFALGDHGAGGGARRVFNNIVMQMRVLPGQTLPEIVLPAVEKPEEGADPLESALDRPGEPLKAKADGIPSTTAPTDFQADGNLMWSLAAGSGHVEGFLQAFRRSEAFEASKQLYPPGWTSHDQFADPRFASVTADWRSPVDLTLRPDSPAINAGVELPADWPDPLRTADAGAPDIGALPAGVAPWPVGVNGRLSCFGTPSANAAPPPGAPAPFSEESWTWTGPSPERRVAIVEGYPEFDAPLLEFAFRKAGAPVERLPIGAWLAPRNYHQYACVVIAGDLQRAGTRPDHYAPDELPMVRDYMDRGGTLLIVRRGRRVFDLTDEGRDFLSEALGTPAASPDARSRAMAIAAPHHPWVRHLAADAPHPWLDAPHDDDIARWRASNGQPIIASEFGDCLLHRLPVGRGQLVYLGWRISDSLPAGRAPASVEQEALFAEQMEILSHLAAEPSGGH
jgi:hypothetical protein